MLLLKKIQIKKTDGLEFDERKSKNNKIKYDGCYIKINIFKFILNLINT